MDSGLALRAPRNDGERMTGLEIPQGREQRQAEQRERPGDEAYRENPEPAAARLLDGERLRPWRCDQRVFALDHAAGDVGGDGVDDCRYIVGFGDHDAAETAILHEAVDALVAPHHDMSDDVDPQPRRIALADAAIEQVDLFGNLRKQRVERLVQNFEPRHFGVAQVDDHAGAIGGLDPRLPQRIAQPYRTRLADGVTPGILGV